jgi:hypothetical protein
MQTVTSFPASAVPPDQLSGIVADYLALDRARVFRRLLVIRFGLLALVAAIAGGVIHGPSLLARWFTSGLFLVPPVWAWVAELRIEQRLSRRLDGVRGVVTHKVRPGVPDLQGDGIRKS